MVRKNPRVRVTFDDEMRPKYRRRVKLLLVGSGVVVSFKKTTQAVQRFKNEQKRCSYGRDRVGARRYEYVSAHGDVHDAASLVAFVEQQRDGVQANSLHDAHGRRADTSPTNRGGDAAATWIFRGGRVAAGTRPRRGYSVELRRRRGRENSVETAARRRYVGAARDIERAIVAGSVLGVKDASRHRDQLFPRGRACVCRADIYDASRRRRGRDDG